MMLRPLFAIFLLAGLATPALAAPIPPDVEAMLRAAAARSDSTLNTTADLAKKSAPASAKEIDAFVRGTRRAAEETRKRKLRHLGLLRGWKGQAQAGLSNATGNNRNTGVSAGVNLAREGLDWTSTFLLNADYQRENGIETRGRYLGSFQSNYRFSDRFYLLGLISWESDRFAGFKGRTSEALGFGFTVLRGGDMTLSVEGGPALRQTDYIVAGPRSTFASRAAVNYGWTITPKIRLTQNLTYYGEDKDSTFTSTTALSVGLIGSLSVQASYNARYESDPPTGLKRYDATARTSLVYSF